MGLSLGCLPRRRPLALATFMPSRVGARSRAASNSVTMARTLKTKSADEIVGVVQGAARVELDVAAGELVGDHAGVGQRPASRWSC